RFSRSTRSQRPRVIPVKAPGPKRTRNASRQDMGDGPPHRAAGWPLAFAPFWGTAAGPSTTLSPLTPEEPPSFYASGPDDSHPLPTAGDVAAPSRLECPRRRARADEDRPMPEDAEKIRAAVRRRFAQVARSPDQERKFPVGPESARKLGYDPQEIDALPRAAETKADRNAVRLLKRYEAAPRRSEKVRGGGPERGAAPEALRSGARPV